MSTINNNDIVVQLLLQLQNSDTITRNIFAQFDKYDPKFIIQMLNKCLDKTLFFNGLNDKLVKYMSNSDDSQVTIYNELFNFYCKLMDNIKSEIKSKLHIYF